ncbi:MAG: DegT/DnrJ/EryC1/StrS family aminotransferase [Candidatus Omnitrophota bacterium]|nr:DegT/DnrJ/EryC1/StrS family aminotransferase [Candidatus Omnitrophota bacterium]
MNHKEKPAILGGKPVFKEPVPITRPTIGRIGRLKKAFGEILRTRMITNSDYVRRFESKLSRHIGVKHAVALSSCTSGLMLIMKALELKGEVIMPSFTFHATAHAAVWNGLKPVFVDCNIDTYNIDPDEVERSITSRTSAIVAVHIFGNPPDIGALTKIAKRHGLKLVFDAAHGLGSAYKGKRVGCFGDAESFSLSPTKLLTTGEGGVVTTNNDRIANFVRMGRTYGDPGSYDPAFSGLSSRMTEFSALLGIEGLDLLEENARRRNRLAGLYKELLSGIPGLSFQKIDKSLRSSYKDFSVLVDKDMFGLSRDLLFDSLAAENISAKKYFYPPVHRQRAFASFGQAGKKLKNTEILSDNSLSLPLYSDMPESDVSKICLAVRRSHRYAREISKAER